MQPDHRVHLVLPCFRESSRIGPFLEQLCLEINALGNVTVQVVDDGSGEEEAFSLRAVLAPFRARFGFVNELLALPLNVGKGGTVYAGWEAGGDAPWLMFADADGAVPAHEVTRLIRRARRENLPARAYFASRVMMLGRKVQRLWYRELMGQMFHWVVDAVLEVPAHDTQCGCKLVPREVFLQTRPSLSLAGFAFDLDLLIGLRAHGCDVVEVPVDWHEVPGGKIRLLRDSWQMLRDVMRIRRRQRAGSYCEGTRTP